MRLTDAVNKAGLYLLFSLGTFVALCSKEAWAHEHTPVTHSFNRSDEPPGPKLLIDIIDRSTGRPAAARFSLKIDGDDYYPGWVDDHGISFTSIHLRSNNRSTMQFAKGTGPVSVHLPEGGGEVTVSVAKGFEYLAEAQTISIMAETTEVAFELERWVNLKADGWIAIDEHLHFDRLDSRDDPLWFTMFEADGLGDRTFHGAQRWHDARCLVAPVCLRISRSGNGWKAHARSRPGVPGQPAGTYQPPGFKQNHPAILNRWLGYTRCGGKLSASARCTATSQKPGWFGRSGARRNPWAAFRIHGRCGAGCG